jgi:hypothetical protein
VRGKRERKEREERERGKRERKDREERERINREIIRERDRVCVCERKRERE